MPKEGRGRFWWLLAGVAATAAFPVAWVWNPSIVALVRFRSSSGWVIPVGLVSVCGVVSLLAQLGHAAADDGIVSGDEGVHRWTETEVQVGYELCKSVMKANRARFDAVWNGANLDGNYLARASVAAMGYRLGVVSLALRSRLFRWPPSVTQREKLLRSLAEGPFSDLVDADDARALLWLACGDPGQLRVRNTPMFASTCIITGTAILRRHQDRDRWERAYRSWIARSRQGTKESFRQSGADID